LRRADIIASTPRFDLAWPSFSLFVENIDRLLKEETVFTTKDLALDGHDIIMILKIKEGPLIGKILEICLAWVLEDPRRNTKETLEAFLKESSFASN